MIGDGEEDKNSNRIQTARRGWEWGQNILPCRPLSLTSATVLAKVPQHIKLLLYITSQKDSAFIVSLLLSLIAPAFKPMELLA